MLSKASNCPRNPGSSSRASPPRERAAGSTRPLRCSGRGGDTRGTVGVRQARRGAHPARAARTPGGPSAPRARGDPPQARSALARPARRGAGRRRGFTPGSRGSAAAETEASREADPLVRLAIQSVPRGNLFRIWSAATEGASTPALIAVLGGLGATGTHGARLEGLRESTRALIETRLAEQMVAKMEDLERVSTQLGRRALFVGWVGVVAAAVGVVATILSLMVQR